VRWSEEALARGVAAGERDAVVEAISCVGHVHPYTAARAAEMLALAPEPVLQEAISTVFRRERVPTAGWHLVVTAYADRQDTLPRVVLDVIERALATFDPEATDEQSTSARRRERADVDVAFFTARLLSWMPRALALRAARVVMLWSDAESLVVAARWVTEMRPAPLDEAVLLCLAAVRGPLRLEATTLRLLGGDVDALDAWLESITPDNPETFAMIACIEEAESLPLPDLWSRWRVPWIVRDVDVRVASLAAARGSVAAIEALRGFARSRRSRLAALAQSELLRVGVG